MSSRENNWRCKECNQENYATRGSCLRCYELKPSVEGVRERPHEGYLTFETGSTSATRTQVMPGDWICPIPGCRTPNASMRETCFNCDASKESRVDDFSWIRWDQLTLGEDAPPSVIDRHAFENSFAVFGMAFALLRMAEGNHQPTGASADVVNGLPQSIVEMDDFADVCAICLDTPEKGETIRHLPCLHKFHKDCIDPWLHRNSTCPLCKASLS